MQCQPLMEDQFQPIIAENYYEPKLFWFELDQSQTKKLVSLFSTSPIITRPSLSMTTEKMGAAQLKKFRVPNTKQECDTGERSELKLKISNTNPINTGGSTLDPSVTRSYSSVVRNVNNLNAHTTQCDVGWFSWEDASTGEEGQLIPCSIDNEVTSKQQQNAVYQNLNCGSSYSCVAKCPQKNWSALFKEETWSDMIKEAEEFIPPASDVNRVHLDLFTGEPKSPHLPDCWEDLEDLGEYDEVACLKSNSEAFHSSLVTEPNTSKLQSSSFEALPFSGARQESKYFPLAALEANIPFSDKFHEEWSSSSKSLGVEEEKHHLKVPGVENPLELSGKDILYKPDHGCSPFPILSRDILSTDYQLKKSKPQLTDVSFPEVTSASEVNSSSIHSTVTKVF